MKPYARPLPSMTLATLTLLTALLAGCGGGGDSSTQTDLTPTAQDSDNTANEAARVTSVKSTPDTLNIPKDAELVLRDAGFSKAAATAFVSRVMRMGEDRRDSAKSAAAALQAAQRLIDNLTHTK